MDNLLCLCYVFASDSSQPSDLGEDTVNDLIGLTNDCLVALTEWINTIITCSGLGCCGFTGLVLVLMAVGGRRLYRDCLGRRDAHRR